METDKLRSIQLVSGGAKVSAQVRETARCALSTPPCCLFHSELNFETIKRSGRESRDGWARGTKVEL